MAGTYRPDLGASQGENALADRCSRSGIRCRKNDPRHHRLHPVHSGRVGHHYCYRRHGGSKHSGIQSLCFPAVITESGVAVLLPDGDVQTGSRTRFRKKRTHASERRRSSRISLCGWPCHATGSPEHTSAEAAGEIGNGSRSRASSWICTRATASSFSCDGIGSHTTKRITDLRSPQRSREPEGWPRNSQKNPGHYWAE